MMYGNGWAWGWMMFMPLLWLLLLGVIIWAAVRLAQPPADRQRPMDGDRASRETPREILDRRFAAGEIDAATYAQIREQLADRQVRSP